MELNDKNLSSLVQAARSEFMACCGTMCGGRDAALNKLAVVEYELENRLALTNMLMASEKPKRILVDLDGTIFDWATPMLEQLDGFTKIEQLNKSKDKWDYILQTYANNREFFKELPLMDFAQSLLTTLKQLDVPIYFFTATGIENNPSLHEQITMDKRYALCNLSSELDFPMSWLENFICTRTSNEKKDFVKPGDLVIDDYYRNCTQAAHRKAVYLHMEGRNNIDNNIRFLNNLAKY